jgi:hypothetical protein
MLVSDAMGVVSLAPAAAANGGLASGRAGEALRACGAAAASLSPPGPRHCLVAGTLTTLAAPSPLAAPR